MTNFDTCDSKILEASQYILDYAMQFDHAHQKQWVLDQVLRILLDRDYDAVIAKYNQEAHKYDQWDEGCE